LHCIKNLFGVDILSFDQALVGANFATYISPLDTHADAVGDFSELVLTLLRQWHSLLRMPLTLGCGTRPLHARWDFRRNRWALYVTVQSSILVDSGSVFHLKYFRINLHFR
jgi:hypothetical protein